MPYQNVKISGFLEKNVINRYELKGPFQTYELTTGSFLEVWFDNQWIETTIEHAGSDDYYIKHLGKEKDLTEYKVRIQREEYVWEDGVV